MPCYINKYISTSSKECVGQLYQSYENHYSYMSYMQEKHKNLKKLDSTSFFWWRSLIETKTSR